MHRKGSLRRAFFVQLSFAALAHIIKFGKTANKKAFPRREGRESFSHRLHFQRLSLYALIVLAQDEEGIEAGHADDAGNHQEGLLVANLVMEGAEGGGEDDLSHLGCNLEAHHVESGRDAKCRVK